MIGKEISFEAVTKNSQRWSWGDVRQTVSEAASSHRKCMIANNYAFRAVACLVVFEKEIFLVQFDCISYANNDNNKLFTRDW